MLYILIKMSVDISYLSGSPVGPLEHSLGGQGLQKCVDCSAGCPPYRSWTCDSSSQIAFWISCVT